ncbi:hypothetical protein L291_3716 [Acinetobacter guillouiae MSP4-18]|nr:hypothetical protein L291_3716 [Acinetobacter guillouiae MSP4-18]
MVASVPAVGALLTVTLFAVIPALLITVAPVVTLPAVPKSNAFDNATSTLPAFTLVEILLFEPTISTASPNFLLTVVPSCAFKPKPKFVNVEPASSTYFLLAASVLFVGAATLVMVLLPALIPALVTLGPPVIVNPLLSNLELPVVTLPAVPKSKFGFNLTCTPSVVATVLIFVSPVMETVSPNFFVVLVAAVSPLKVKPVLSTAAFAATPLAMSVLVAAARSTL